MVTMATASGYHIQKLNLFYFQSKIFYFFNIFLPKTFFTFKKT